MRPLGEQLRAARERAGINKTELGRRLGWSDHSNVTRIEDGRDTSTDSLLRWAEECGHEVLIAPGGSTESLAARLNDADERERRLAAALLDLLRDARQDAPHVLDYFEDDIRAWRARLANRRILDAG